MKRKKDRLIGQARGAACERVDVLRGFEWCVSLCRARPGGLLVGREGEGLSEAGEVLVGFALWPEDPSLRGRAPLEPLELSASPGCVVVYYPPDTSLDCRPFRPGTRVAAQTYTRQRSPPLLQCTGWTPAWQRRPLRCRYDRRRCCAARTWVPVVVPVCERLHAACPAVWMLHRWVP